MVANLGKGRLSNKNQRNNQIRVITSWQYVREPSPAFRRLMMLLLKPPDNQSVDTVRTDEEHKDEQC